MKRLVIYIVTCSTVCIFLCIEPIKAQTDSLIGKLFYGLNLDSSRAFIKKTLESDKRFLKIQGPYKHTLYEDTYYGFVLDKGSIKSHPDSVKVSLSFGIGGSTSYSDGHIPSEKEKEDANELSSEQTYFDITYYFFYRDSLEKAYTYLMSYLYSNDKKIEFGGKITTEDTKKTGESCNVFLRKEHVSPSLQITKWTLPTSRFPTPIYSLELEYRRKGK